MRFVCCGAGFLGWRGGGGKGALGGVSTVSFVEVLFAVLGLFAVSFPLLKNPCFSDTHSPPPPPPPPPPRREQIRLHDSPQRIQNSRRHPPLPPTNLNRRTRVDVFRCALILPVFVGCEQTGIRTDVSDGRLFDVQENDGEEERGVRDGGSTRYAFHERPRRGTSGE